MELALIFVLELAGLLLALSLSRSLFGTTPDAGVRRVAAAIFRATQAFAARALLRVAGGAVASGVALASACLLVGRPDAALDVALGVALGTLLAVGSALVAHLAGTRASAVVMVGAATRFDLALSSALRAAGAVGVTSQALAVLGALGVFGLGHLLHGGDADAAARARGALLALPGFAFGASVVALVLARTSGIYAAAARAGELRAGLLSATTARQASMNPALVSAAVGERLEHGVGAARLFAASAAAASAALVLGVTGAEGPLSAGRQAAFPLLVWAFGLIANGAGLFVARSLEAQGAGPALARGQASIAAVWLFGLLGGGYWLFPECWLPLAAAAAVGFVLGALGSGAVAHAARRQAGPLRAALDGLRAGAAISVSSAFAFGLALSAFGLVCVGLGAIIATRLGAATGLPGGERVALLLAIFGVAVWSPYAMAVEAGCAIAETARRLGIMGGAEPEALQRVQRLLESEHVAQCIARCHGSVSTVVSALAAGLVVTAPSAGPGGESSASSAWIALLGVAWVLWGVGRAVQRASLGSREVTLEVDRQLSVDLPGVHPEGRAPSYRACEEVAGRAGLAGAFGGVLEALIGPVVLGIALRLVYRESGPRLAAEALATFVAGAAVTALGVALTVDGARAALAGARRANRSEADPATVAASATGEALAEILSSAAGPVAGILALLAASLVLFAKTILP